MKKKEPTSSPADLREDLWPMGVVTRRTGITEHTLRAWERRFGFPKPVRLPSGHRRFTADQVRQLLLINRALRCGYRAGDVVPLEPGRIENMIRECGDDTTGPEPKVISRRWVDDVLRDAVAFDESSIRTKMQSEAAVLGVSKFLRDRAVPLINELGEAWVREEIGIRHEHFVSGILEDNLRGLRRPFEASAVGRPVVLACLPDELHGLGLELVAAEVAAEGRKILVLGPQTPVEEIAATAKALDAAAVGLSVSVFSSPDRTIADIEKLREDLPSRTVLWVGGGGAQSLSLPDKTSCVDALDDVADSVRKL